MFIELKLMVVLLTSQVPTSTGTLANASWAKAPLIKTEDGNFRLRLGLLLQADSRFFAADDREALTDQFLLRRIRLDLEGTVFEVFDLRLYPDFAGGALVLHDAYIEYKPAKFARLRVGKFKTQFGLERLIG